MFQILFTPQSPSLHTTASWGPTKESLFLLYKAFVRPVLTYASPGWFPFLCNTATTKHLEVLHRAACRVISGCLSSTPSSPLLLENQLPPLKLTLKHQALSSFKRALRLPPLRLLQPQCPGNTKRALSIKEETLLEIILFFGHTTTPIPT